MESLIGIMQIENLEYALTALQEGDLSLLNLPGALEMLISGFEILQSRVQIESDRLGPT
jgi:hypothetical protein